MDLGAWVTMIYKSTPAVAPTAGAHSHLRSGTVGLGATMALAQAMAVPLTEGSAVVAGAVGFGETGRGLSQRSRRDLLSSVPRSQSRQTQVVPLIPRELPTYVQSQKQV